MSESHTTSEKKIIVRRLTVDDFDALVELQRACFKNMPTWDRAHIEAQVRTFPEGQICVEYEGKLVASSSSLIVDGALFSDWHNWRKVAGDGYISNHDPEGDTLYGIEIMVHPEYRGLKLSRRLYDARKMICRKENLLRIVIGGRIPGYHQHADELSAMDYAERVVLKSLYDPVLTAQIANGFVLKQIIPNYLPADVESKGNATFLEWTNPDFVPKQRHQQLYTLSRVRLCMVQYQMRTLHDFHGFERQCEFFIDVASGYKADFVTFPELLTTQLLSIIEPSSRPGESVRKIADYTEQYCEFFSRMAVRYNINIIGGTHLMVEDDTLYNVAYLFRRDGTIARQKKLHITPSERQWWGVQPGDKLEVFDTDRGKIAILICYDVEFPELARIATAKGARIIFVPFNTDERQGYIRVRISAQARCIENQIYTCISGCTGNLPFVENVDIHYAQSGIFSPSDFSFSRDGVVAECNPNIETVVIHDVDVQALRRARHAGVVQNWRDRRKDMYSVRYKDGDTFKDA